MNQDKLLKGKLLADKNFLYCSKLIQDFNLTPHLYVLIVGDDPASDFYVNSIKKQAAKLNIKLTIDKSNPLDMTEEILVGKIQNLNLNNDVHGIMVQKPLPKHIDPSVIETAISPQKDVDGFHPLNAGLLLLEKDCFLPCTAQAILEIIDYYNISTEGKHVVVIGRSNVVGKPIANLLLYKKNNRNATVTICHSKTPDIALFTKQADILITAIGSPNFVNNSMLKENVIILDAGINEINNCDGTSVYVGDVDFQSCLSKANLISPVPGGIGSVTTSILFKHLCDSAKKLSAFEKNS